MPELNSLSFTEFKSEFLESLRGKCEHDQSYTTVWSKVKTRGPSHSNGSVHDDTSTHSSPLMSDELMRWNIFTIDDGYLLHKGRVCVPSDLDTRCQILYECHDSPNVVHRGV